MNFAIDQFNEERFGLVTGSRCSPLVPKRSAEVGQRTLAKSLANEMYFKFYDEMSNRHTEHGQMAEIFALQHYQQYYDPTIEQGKWYKSGDVGGNTDAEAKDYGADWKCPTSLKAWTDFIFDPLSDDEINQCQHYMMMTKKDRWIIGGFLMETLWMSDNGLTYPVKEEKRMLIVEVKKDPIWQEKFLSNLPTVVKMRDEFHYVLKAKELFNAGSG